MAPLLVVMDSVCIVERFADDSLVFGRESLRSEALGTASKESICSNQGKKFRR
jgi:hypothetical protein